MFFRSTVRPVVVALAWGFEAGCFAASMDLVTEIPDFRMPSDCCFMLSICLSNNVDLALSKSIGYLAGYMLTTAYFPAKMRNLMR